MKTLTTLELFNKANNSTSLDVQELSAAAGDNAADTVGWMMRFEENGQFTDEFLDEWLNNIELMLCINFPKKEAIEFFAINGVNPHKISIT